MIEEVSLSIEETNKIREQLGLPLILVPSLPPKSSSSPTSFTQTGDKETDSKDDKVRSAFIDDRALQLQRRIARGKKRTLIYESNDDWLGSVKDAPKKSSLRNSEDYQDTIEQEMTVSHNIDLLPTGRDIVLTLKDTDADEEGYTLENVDIKHSEEDAKNIKLRQLNKQRKFKKGILASHVHLDDEFDTDGDFVLPIGKSTVASNTLPSSEEMKAPEGKRRVIFVTAIEEHSEGDYAPIKIKRRKVNSQKQQLRSKDVKVPQAPVSLVDEDSLQNDEEELYEMFSIKRRDPTEKEQLKDDAIEDRKLRARYLQKLQNSKVFDETDAFLDSLKNDILEPEVTQTTTPVEPSDASPKNAQPMSERIHAQAAVEQVAPNFYDGIASTLRLLKDRSIPVTTTAATDQSLKKKRDFLKLQQQIAIRETEQSIENELAMKDVSYTNDDLVKINEYKSAKVAKVAAQLQHERLQGYNPNVKLHYKDSDGNELTTKEAYKHISQAWHGTKSNPKKLRRQQQKMRDRQKAHEQGSYIQL